MANRPTKTKTPETTIRAELAKLEWMIPDAKRDLAKPPNDWPPAGSRRSRNATR